MGEMADNLQSELDKINNQITAIQGQIVDSQKKIDNLNAQIKKNEILIKQRRKAMGQVLADMHVDDQISPLEMLASSNSIGDYIDKQEQRSSLRTSLNGKIKEIKALQKKKVFYRWNYAFPIGEMPVERATYKAEYISPPKANVEYEVDGVITASESVDLMKSPVKVPENPVVSGKNFKGWQAGGVGKLYTKAELEHMEIVRNMTFVAKLEKDSADPPSPTPGPMPGPGPIPGPTPGPSPDSENSRMRTR